MKTSSASPFALPFAFAVVVMLVTAGCDNKTTPAEVASSDAAVTNAANAANAANAGNELRAPIGRGGVPDDTIKPVAKTGIPDDSIKPVAKTGVPDDGQKPLTPVGPKPVPKPLAPVAPVPPAPVAPVKPVTPR